MIINALHNKLLPVYGDGANVRDWLYVEGHCSAIDLIIRQGREGEVYNVGGHNEKSNLDVVKIILKALDKSEDLITFVKDRPGMTGVMLLTQRKYTTSLAGCRRRSLRTALPRRLSGI